MKFITTFSHLISNDNESPTPNNLLINDDKNDNEKEFLTSSIPPSPNRASSLKNKSSSLVKVLSASTLVISIVRNMLAQNNNQILNNLTDAVKLDEYHVLTECVSEKAESILKTVRMIKDSNPSASNGQHIYNALISSSTDLADALIMFVGFVKDHLPHIAIEEPFTGCSTTDNDNSSINLKKKSSFKKKVLKSFKTLRRNVPSPLGSPASTFSFSKDKDKDTRSKKFLGINGHIFSGRRSNGDLSVYRKRSDSIGSNASSISNVSSLASIRTMPNLNTHGNTQIDPLSSSAKKSFRKKPFPYLRIETSFRGSNKTEKHRKLHILREKRDGQNIEVHEKEIEEVDLNDIEEQHSIGWASVASSLNNTPTSSKFREHFEGAPAQMTGGRHRRASDASIRTPYSTRSLYVHENLSTKSALSVLESSHRNSIEDHTRNKTEDEKSRRNSSHSSIKSYLLKHISQKSKSKFNKKGKGDYWPVNESIPTTPKNTSEYSDAPQLPLSARSSTSSTKSTRSTNRLFSLKRPKVPHKMSSESDIRSLKKRWAEYDADKSLSTHPEEIKENSSSDNNNNAHSDVANDEVFYRIVTKKSSNSLNIKKKPSLTSLLKPPSLFSTSHNRGSADFSDFDDGELVQYCNAHSKEGLALGVVDKRPQVLYGTIENLISWMVDEDGQDLEFIDVFILCHGFFMESRDFLENMILRFHIQSQGSDDNANNFSNYVQINILSILHRWVTIQSENFQDQILYECLVSFLDDDVKNAGFLGEADQIKFTLKEQLSDNGHDKLQNAAKILPMNDYNNSTQLFMPPSELLDTSPLLDYDAKSIAKYLTYMDYSAFKSITLYDYITGWRKKRQMMERGTSDSEQHETSHNHQEAASRIDEFIRRSNMISHWVAYEICKLKEVKMRKNMLQKFIEVAKHCRQMNNFQTSMTIILGLNSRSIRRLEETWANLANKHIITSQQIEKLLDTSKNMDFYRQALARCRPPAVPFFATCLKDITAIMEANETFIANSTNTINTAAAPSNQESQHQLQQINWQKLRLLIKNLYAIIGLHSETYKFTSTNPSSTFDDKELMDSFPSPTPSIADNNTMLHSPFRIRFTASSPTDSPIFSSSPKFSPNPLSGIMLDNIGEIIERRIYLAAGDLFLPNSENSSSSNYENDGSEKLMELSRIAEPDEI
ncbi:10269_t:CDS:10 [Ambispora leptoticha]|uniref:10269_t:CDS:1 n=1 Tax=Ambispora leptoticha TaxID=144679 RepID=A0A9N9FEK6_9GLOM|nr:10269_t:CDS:10 [Ambispora leptoticha]